MGTSSRVRRSTLAVAVAAAAAVLVTTAAWGQGKVTVSVVPRTTTVEPGAEFEVDVFFDAAVPVRTAQVALVFDPSLVEVLGVEEGAMLKDFAASQEDGSTLPFPDPPAIDNDAGTVEAYSISVMGMKVVGGATGRGLFATFKLRAKDGASGIANLALDNVVVGDELANEIPSQDVNVLPGQVGVGVALEGAATSPPPVPVAPTATTETDAAAMAPGAPAGAPTFTLPPVGAGQTGAATPEAQEGQGGGGSSLPTSLILAVAGVLVVAVVAGLVVMRNR